MNRAVTSLLFLLAACGAKHQASVCDQNPPPAACMETCNPNGANTCPLGFYCGGNGKCTADCGQGTSCPSGQTCTSDGHCVGGNGGPDADCPNVVFTPMKTTPSIELVLDRSGSMDMTDIAPTRFRALQSGLFDPTNGAVTKTQGAVYFGEAMFAGDQSPCLNLNGFTAPRALNNATALSALTANNPPNGGSTPTADAITKVTADFAANPPPMGSPPIILLATDGEPNSCNGGGGNGPSLTAIQAAYTAGIRTFIIGLAGLNLQYLQDVANAGTGKPINQPPMCANCSPYYAANDPTSLVNGLDAIINGVLSCDLSLTGMVDPMTACNGTVTLNGMTLTCGTDWQIDPNGMVIHLLGSACNTLKNSANPTVSASFPCGTVIQ